VGKNKLVKLDAFEMFCYASAYREAAAIIDVRRFTAGRAKALKDLSPAIRAAYGFSEEDAFDVTVNPDALTIPSSLLFTLSLEVHLKCLVRVRRRMPIAEHNMKKLFERLGRRDRQAIKRRFLENYEQYDGKRRVKIDSVIQRSSRFFVEIRYGYEYAPPRMPAADDESMRGTFGFRTAVNAVRSVILDKNPDWHERYLRRGWFF
jgi:hypothetical protein